MNLYGFGKAVTYLYVRLAFSMKYEGLENIPQDEGFIICCNHRGYNDPLFIAHKVKKPLHYMAKAEFYKNKFISALFRSLNAFPVDRGKGDMTAINHAKDIVKKGEVLAMFPEGSRSKDGKPQRAKPGVTMIAGMVGCGVLPVGVSYQGNLGFRKRVTVRYGKLLTPEKLGIDPKSSSTIRKAAVQVMDSIVGLMDKDCYGTYEPPLQKTGR
ncbi:1-acyl-sn-glycerol-3-phosphate acyltransferase [Ruminococcaceae bacterium OttesenSCG-928-L11]|nr:1-acyl-sn-glycerol-3-phosphate acyltransferase [Ruminococcaceae bacterium OttesenSCG-928-L11]